MTFPAIRSSGASATNLGPFASTAITLPTHAAGDLILVVFGVNSNSTLAINAGASSAGWSLTTQVGSSTFLKGIIAHKVAASGSETLTITNTVSGRPGYLVYVITAGTYSSWSQTVAQATSGSINPPVSGTPTASADHLFIAAGLLLGANAATVAPTDFGSLLAQNATTTSAVSPAGATRQLNTASPLDPGTFTNTSNYWIAYNILVEGTAPPDTTPPVITDVVGTGGANISSGTFTSDEAGTAYWKLTATSTPESVPAYPGAMTGWTSMAMIAGANNIASLTTTLGTYWLQVAAQDDEATPNRVSAPTVSASSFTVTDVVGPPPGAPGTPTFSLATKSSYTVEYTAASGSVTGYEYRINSGSWVNVGNVLTFDVSGRTPGSTDSVQVRAYGPGGAGATNSASIKLALFGFAFSTAAGLEFGTISGALTGLGREAASTAWTVFVHNDTTRALVATSGSLTTNSSGRLPDFTSAALDAGTYFVSFRRTSDGAWAGARLATVDLS